MAAPTPKLITDSLFEKLFPSLESGKNLLGEWEIFNIIREAKKIPNEEQSSSVIGLAYIVLGDINKGSEYCERAIELNPYVSAVWSNYAIAVGVVTQI